VGIRVGDGVSPDVGKEVGRLVGSDVCPYVGAVVGGVMVPDVDRKVGPRTSVGALVEIEGMPVGGSNKSSVGVSFGIVVGPRVEGKNDGISSTPAEGL